MVAHFTSIYIDYNVIFSQPGFCFVAPFDPLDLFPSFVRYKAYRPLAIQQVSSGQSYKASTIVIYESRVVNMSNLLVTTTVES